MAKPKKTRAPLVEAILHRVASIPVVIPTETITIPAGAAGTIKNFNIAQAPIANSAGNDVGAPGDTSITLTSNTFTTEVTPKADGDLANGEYYVDYLTGRARGKKADTGTSATIVYKAFALRGVADPFDDLKTVTPNNSTDLPDGVCRGLYCTVAGDVNVDTYGGTTQVIPLQKYQVLPLRVKRVRSTSTTATVLAGY